MQLQTAQPAIDVAAQIARFGGSLSDAISYFGHYYDREMLDALLAEKSRQEAAQRTEVAA